MNDQKLQQQSVEEVARALGDEPLDRRIVHCEADSQWYPELLREVSEHSLNVLARAADVIVFFDEHGNEIGWRDDGRHGAERPAWIDADLFLQIVINELKLPPGTRLGNLAPRELAPLGWTHEGQLLLPSPHSQLNVLRVWVDPVRLRVIQCLAGSMEERAS